MAMEITKTFLVRAPVDVAWKFLVDPARVAACLPGAAITERVDDQTYRGTITVKVGPVAASYKGTMRFARLDPDGHTAEIVASGSDTRGRGGADMVMNSRLEARAPGETEVTIVSQVNVMGVLAQFGRGMIQDVSDQMFQRFVTAMRGQLESASSQPDATAAGAPAGAADSTSALRIFPPEPEPGMPDRSTLLISATRRAPARRRKA